jgi:hypothetical protein
MQTVEKTKETFRVTVDIDLETLKYLRREVVAARIAKGFSTATDQVVVRIIKAIDAGHDVVPLRKKES